ncbi:MAG: crossover junction endodeoxyribonuclease RuvC [bacterium]|nr:crossover junction endodeoxyribonuclease RuvC [bacterium]
MRVLGIDPGIERVGWGITVSHGNDATYINCGCIKTSKKLSHYERLTLVADKLKQVIIREKPDKASVEKLFFSTNKKTALTVAEARGVILYTIHKEGLPIEEFTPLEVKMAITGNGKADKKQVAWMVKNILKIKEDITQDDALDALALSLMIRS